MVGLVLVAAALGLSNFAAAVGIGISGVDGALRWRVAVVFGIFEGGMPVVGLFIGHRLARSVGAGSRYLGGGLLILTGIYTIWQAQRGAKTSKDVASRIGPLVVTGAALSIDNLVIGFALGTYKVSIGVAAITIGVVSVAMSLIGLELGARLGRATESWSGVIGGAILSLVGIAIAARWF